jgi:hypothetical protein
MAKNVFRLFIILLLLNIIIQIPPATAQSAGVIAGKTVDRNGNPLSGVVLTLQDKDYKALGNDVSGADGQFSFDGVPMESSCDIFRLIAKYDKGDLHLSTSTAFFEVLASRVTRHDVTFYDYPRASSGQLGGQVWLNDRLETVAATIYLSNGMYTFFNGGRFDQWAFNLPAGTYTVWAERNVDNRTYASQKHDVVVTGGELAPMSINMKEETLTGYHPQPGPMYNVVHGTVRQKSGAPYDGALVDLCRRSGNDLQSISSTTTNASGQYTFYGVNVDSVSAEHVIRVTYDAGGSAGSQVSDPFTVYYANTFNVPHAFEVPVTIQFTNSGDAIIQSTPSGASIWVDGAYVGRTPFEATGLRAGQHSIGLWLDGYYDDNITIQVQPGEVTRVYRELVSNTGSLFLDVSPVDARVYLDGEYAGVGPQNLSGKPCGPHTYTIVCDGYRNESGTLYVQPDNVTCKKIDMVAVPGLSLTYVAYLINNMLVAISSIFSGGR